MLTSPWPVVRLVGYALMGLGLAPVMPVVLRRAGSSGRMSPKAASAVVSLFGYSGLLVVPPALGFVTRHAGLATALLIPLSLHGSCCRELYLQEKDCPYSGVRF